MRPATRRSTSVAAVALAVLVAACGGSATTSPPESQAATPAATPGDPTPGDASPVATERPAPTAIPGATLVTPPPPPPSTTETDWGTILDALPDGFPLYPGAQETEVDEPVSGAFSAAAPAAEVADWYATAFEEVGLSVVGLTGPFEDGSMVLDAMGGIPECLAQVAFRPAGESTIISVLYGAGCAGAAG